MKKIFFSIKKLLILYFILFFYFIQAQKNSDSISIESLQDVVTFGKKKSLEVIPHQQISKEELDKVNGLSVADAVRLFSGVQLKDYGGVGGIKTVNIRGMGSQHVGVFYDGVSLGNAQNGTVDLGKFSLDNMESISLYNGQKSEILQSAKDFATASSIYLKSKKPIFLENKKNNIGIQFRTGSFALINPSVLWEQKISPTLSSSLNLEYLNSNGKYKFRYRKNGLDTIAIRTNGNISAFRAEWNLNGIIKNGTWSLKNYYYDSDRQIPGAVIKNSYQRYQFEKQWDRNYFVQGTLEKDINPRYKVLIHAKYANDYTHYYDHTVLGDYVSKHFDNVYKQQEFYISLAQQYKLFDFWNIALATDYQFNHLTTNFYKNRNPKRNAEWVALSSNFNWNRLKFQTSVLGSFIQDQVADQSTEANSRNEFTPSFFASYKLLKNINFTFHAFYKQIFRMPTFNDLCYTEIGSSNLKPEYVSQYDIGLHISHKFSEGILTNISATVDGYYNEVKDKIVAFPRGQQFRWAMFNIGEVKIRGIEISTQSTWQLMEHMQMYTHINYTFESAQDVTGGLTGQSTYKNQIPYIPKNSGNLLVGSTFKTWDLSYSLVYTGSRYSSSENIKSNYLPEWITHDINFTKLIPMKNMNLKAGIEVSNLFNKQYEIVLNYPMPGRSYRISLRAEL
ncbi:TonB-dependent receptor [Apibacter muscae]|uniref:TonB-dependent receptor n=1 Tax=Apibacter muscae TaxID=2509004 RepID=UPI0011AC5E6A|nr:TonB-dependent receptor [Apibacter muscae]TWP27922.1 TonB-dependent receptor [Apibacter muscae]